VSRSVSRTAAFLLLAACEGGFLPLRSRIDVGQEPMIVFVAGPATAGDLYALASVGGKPIAITFSPVSEAQPALAPSGDAVAFLRSAALNDSTAASVWILNLATGAERKIDLPAGAGAPERVGWTADGRGLIVRAGGRLYRADATADGASPVIGAGRAAAESSLAVLLGEPVFAEVVSCTRPGDLCVRSADGRITPLARGATDPARWGSDSVAYLEGDRLVVRPVGPGRPRSVNWTGVPQRPRQLSVFPGSTSEPR
jgi:hypothetical protein